MREGAKDARPDENVRMARGGYYVGKGAFVGYGRASPTVYLGALDECLKRTAVTGELVAHGEDLDVALTGLRRLMVGVHGKGGRVIFVGNGGSAAIASHMAVDYTKNGGIRALALNDSATLTCFGNDFGYEQVFAKQIEAQATKRDLVVIVSSSGKSPNILEAARQTENLCPLVTLTGMNPANMLRRLGDLNFYVPCTDYGLVEITHLCLLHSIVDK